MASKYKIKLFPLILFLSVVTFCIYLVSFRYTFQEILDDKSAHKRNIGSIQEYPLFVRHFRIETMSYDNGTNGETSFSLITNQMPELIPKNLQNHLQVNSIDDQESLKELKELLQGTNSSRNIEFQEDFLIAYIKNTKHDVMRAFSKIQNYLNLRAKHNYFFHNMNFDFTENPAYRFLTPLPRRTPKGSKIVLFEIAKWNPDRVPLEHLKKLLFITIMQEVRNPISQERGFNMIYDFKNVGLRYVKFMTAENIHLLNHVSFDVAPMIFVGIHLVNVNIFGNLMVTMIRPFLPTYIKKILYTHSSIKKLHEYLPIPTLPVQYGGSLRDYYMSTWLRKANEQHNNYPIEGQKNIS